MNIVTFGSRFYGGQVSRIDSGLESLGNIVNKSNIPDLIYSNDMSHANEAIQEWEKCDKNPKLILNVLDCPAFLPQWPAIKLEWHSRLLLADKVTCISKAVQNDIKIHFNIEANVIYNPIKDVKYRPEIEKDIISIFVGRANSPNKRVKEIVYPLWLNLRESLGDECIHFVGSENPGFGKWWGVISDDKLNELYNKSVMGIISSKEEGLNLPMLEMICTNCKPIICKDMSTAQELGIPELMCDPNPKSMFYKMKEVASQLSKYDNILNEYGKKYSIMFDKKTIAQNILNVYAKTL